MRGASTHALLRSAWAEGAWARHRWPTLPSFMCQLCDHEDVSMVDGDTPVEREVVPGLRGRALAEWRRSRAVELAGQGLSYDEIATAVGFRNRGTAHRVVTTARGPAPPPGSNSCVPWRSSAWTRCRPACGTRRCLGTPARPARSYASSNSVSAYSAWTTSRPRGPVRAPWWTLPIGGVRARRSPDSGMPLPPWLLFRSTSPRERSTAPRHPRTRPAEEQNSACGGRSGSSGARRYVS